MAGAVALRGFLTRHSRLLDCMTITTCMSARIRPVQTDCTGLCHDFFWKTVPVRTLHLCPNFCAGHNKWSKVKHIKGPKDAARSRMFMRLAMMIRIAVKEGGSSNPEFNIALANVVEQCRGKNMPKASIEAAIKGAEKSKAGTQHTYEARGPGGCMLLIDILTDNNTRSLQEVRHLLNKHGAALCEGAHHSFMRKGVVVALGEGVSSERALELAIEAGAEDVQEMDDEDEKPILRFLCGMSEQKKVRMSLEELGVRTVSASLEFVPTAPTQLPQDQLEAAFSLIEALNDYTDVLRVWDNIQSQS
ncbi:translational activator of cytochrome c oxidase 1 [Esox lucius]|uniref:Translational activator of cytochrome c oxidase 1 n=1 Tax=Esox lucius TaxID=8010 RepID=C1BXQ5_ESOLU|nr:translational activator of cytochrome c oxidase 1 [Esox lucius]ACO13808.1 Coiled-coil domain-containing protein 44 [Esox lucius]